MMFTKFTTGNSTAKVHLRVKGFVLTLTVAKAPKAACGARVTINCVSVADDAEVTCQVCHAGLVK